MRVWALYACVCVWQLELKLQRLLMEGQFSAPAAQRDE
jgi:hypothetical protein